MILNEQQCKEFEAEARPLIEWLNNNCHPHVIAIIDPACAILTESVYSVPIEDYIEEG